MVGYEAGFGNHCCFSFSDVVALIPNNDLREHRIWLRPELFGDKKWLKSNASYRSKLVVIGGAFDQVVSGESRDMSRWMLL